MGKDYRHNNKNRGQQFDDDGFDGFHKLQKYDRDKTRKQNKVNLNHFDVQLLEEDVEWLNNENIGTEE